MGNEKLIWPRERHKKSTDGHQSHVLDAWRYSMGPDDFRKLFLCEFPAPDCACPACEGGIYEEQIKVDSKGNPIVRCKSCGEKWDVWQLLGLSTGAGR